MCNFDDGILAIISIEGQHDELADAVAFEFDIHFFVHFEARPDIIYFAIIAKILEKSSVILELDVVDILVEAG